MLPELPPRPSAYTPARQAKGGVPASRGARRMLLSLATSAVVLAGSLAYEHSHQPKVATRTVVIRTAGAAPVPGAAAPVPTPTPSPPPTSSTSTTAATSPPAPVSAAFPVVTPAPAPAAIPVAAAPPAHHLAATFTAQQSSGTMTLTVTVTTDAPRASVEAFVSDAGGTQSGQASGAVSGASAFPITVAVPASAASFAVYCVVTTSSGSVTTPVSNF